MKLTAVQAKRLARAGASSRVRLAVLYGSRAVGTARKESDVDIAVLGTAALTFESQRRLQTAFAKTLGVSVDSIDLVDLCTAPPLLVYYIARDGTVIAGSEREAERFHRSAMKRYIDGKRLFAATEDYVKTHGG